MSFQFQHIGQNWRNTMAQDTDGRYSQISDSSVEYCENHTCTSSHTLPIETNRSIYNEGSGGSGEQSRNSGECSAGQESDASGSTSPHPYHNFQPKLDNEIQKKLNELHVRYIFIYVFVHTVMPTKAVL